MFSKARRFRLPTDAVSRIKTRRRKMRAGGGGGTTGQNMHQQKEERSDFVRLAHANLLSHIAPGEIGRVATRTGAE